MSGPFAASKRNQVPLTASRVNVLAYTFQMCSTTRTNQVHQPSRHQFLRGRPSRDSRSQGKIARSIRRCIVRLDYREERSSWIKIAGFALDRQQRMKALVIKSFLPSFYIDENAISMPRTDALISSNRYQIHRIQSVALIRTVYSTLFTIRTRV